MFLGVIESFEVQSDLGSPGSHESHQFRDDGDGAKSANFPSYDLVSNVRLECVYTRLVLTCRV